MEQYQRLLEYAKQSAIEYINGINQAPAYPYDESLLALNRYEETLPDVGMDSLSVLKLLHTVGSRATTAQVGGKYFGFVNGGLLPIAHAAEWIADTWNQNGALAVMSPVTAKLEALCEKWIVELFGLPQGTAMGLVTGSSNAMLCALTAARNSLLKKAGHDIWQQGMINAPQLQVVVSADAHASVITALNILGFGKNDIKVIPTDEYGRIQINDIPQMDDRTLCIIQAGNVNGGSYDPIEEICNIANQVGAWVHIDGAFGLWAAASKRYRYLTMGLKKADSWSVDAHKTLNAGYDCGIVLCKNRDALVSALQANGAYIQYGAQRDGMLYTTEMSRRARAIPLWAVLKALGTEGIEQLINNLCKHAEYFADQLCAAGFNVINPVFFNQFMVNCETDEKTEAVLQYIQHSGICWCGGSKWKGHSIIRISVCSHATTQVDIDQSVAVFKNALQEVQKK